MARLILVRHGEAAAGWGADPDPGLSPLGRSQATAAADVLAPDGPLPTLVSPLRRCRETAAPLAQRWEVEPVVAAGVGEVESPTADLAERAAWLQGVLGSRWDEVEPRVRAWADEVVECLLGIPGDAVVVSHFVAINVAIGRAMGDDRVVVKRIGNASRTVVANDGGRLTLVSDPVEVAATDVL